MIDSWVSPSPRRGSGWPRSMLSPATARSPLRPPALGSPRWGYCSCPSLVDTRPLRSSHPLGRRPKPGWDREARRLTARTAMNPATWTGAAEGGPTGRAYPTTRRPVSGRRLRPQMWRWLPALVEWMEGAASGRPRGGTPADPPEYPGFGHTVGRSALPVVDDTPGRNEPRRTRVRRGSLCLCGSGSAVAFELVEESVDDV